jgi:Cdc6-like AAA superfamily ATPase
MPKKMNTIFDSEAMARLLTLVEEGAKTDGEGVKHFVEPARGTLQRATTKRHHIIFGRRGSGKSSLLRKAAADLTVDRRPIAYVNLEKFKAHSYPDVLLSVLISTFSEFEEWLRTAAIHPANKRSFWKRVFDSTPSRAAFNKAKAEELACAIKEEISSLEAHLHSADDVATTRSVKSKREESATTQLKGEIGHAGLKLGSTLSGAEGHSAEEERKEEYRQSKVDFLHRHILGYQKLFRRMSELSGGASYLILDDLYHIRRADQPQLVDYFYRIAKDNNLWLKMGTIRHRTSWYVHGDPPIGVKLGDDADEIDLDLTLDKYSMAKEFLVKILKNFVSECEGLTVSGIVNDGGIERLVLASGGVARDFLAIFRRAVDVARERGIDHRGSRIGSEDVNKAAGEHEPSKREELKRDAPDARREIEEQFERIIKFCVDSAKANVFLVDKDATGKNVDLLHELVDLRLIHLVRSRVTVSNRPGKIFEGYMLDVSQYTGSRKRHNFELVEFWKAGSEEQLRRVKLIYDIEAGDASQLAPALTASSE